MVCKEMMFRFSSLLVDGLLFARSVVVVVGTTTLGVFGPADLVLRFTVTLLDDINASFSDAASINAFCGGYA
jgi:hypothetical protein